MSQEVKVTIEWNGNTAGLHEEPMTVHIAGKADPNEIIGAVAKAMGAKDKHEKPKCKDDDYIRLCPKDDNVTPIKDAERHTFPSWQVTCDWISQDYGNGKTAL
jgi:hypothetical protein